MSRSSVIKLWQAGEQKIPSVKKFAQTLPSFDSLRKTKEKRFGKRRYVDR